MLEPMNDDELNALCLRAKALTRQRFGRVVQLYAPLYLSNECIDICSYCGFSLQNKIPRKTMTPSEVENEAEFLSQTGFRHLLMVSGEHPSHVSPDYLDEVITRLRPHWSSLSLEVAPFSSAVYRRLIDEGLDGIVLYQETYDPSAYAKVHLAGPKKSFEKRLAAPEEATKAGVRFLGMGILLGLTNWRQEALSLVDHVIEIKKKYWRTEITVSLPRLRPCASNFSPPHPVSDRDFLQLIAALRIALPDVGIVLSTREVSDLRDLLIGMGVTHMSAGSRTEPGGYRNPDESLKQFETEDRRTVAEVAAAIRQRGYEPVWKDWEAMSPSPQPSPAGGEGVPSPLVGEG